jgi:hypothetical protein
MAGAEMLGVCAAADHVACLKHLDSVTSLLQSVGGGHPGRTGADNSNAHIVALSSPSRH